MKPSQSLKEFEKFLGEQKEVIASLGASRAVDAMTEFYVSKRAKGCSIADDGDMLVYQWGLEGWDDDEVFEFEMARQFIRSNFLGESISQLRLTLKYRATDDLRKLESGNKWCSRPDEIAGFRKFVITSEAFLSSVSVIPLQAELLLEAV